MPQQRRSTIILTPDHFGNFTRDIPLENIYYEGEKIEADAILSNSGELICYQPKGDITGLPDFLEPHQVSFRKGAPPPPPAAKDKRVALGKDGAVVAGEV